MTFEFVWTCTLLLLYSSALFVCCLRKKQPKSFDPRKHKSLELSNDCLFNQTQTTGDTRLQTQTPGLGRSVDEVGMTPQPRAKSTGIVSPFDAKKKCLGGSNSDNPNARFKRGKVRTKPVCVPETRQTTKMTQSAKTLSDRDLKRASNYLAKIKSRRAMERERRLSREPLVIDGPPAESFDEEPLPAEAQPSNAPTGLTKSMEPLKTAELLPSQQDKPTIVGIKEDKTQSSRAVQSVVVESRPMKNSVHLPIL